MYELNCGFYCLRRVKDDKIEKYIFNSQNVYVQQAIYSKLIFPWETKYQ